MELGHLSDFYKFPPKMQTLGGGVLKSVPILNCSYQLQIGLGEGRRGQKRSPKYK